MCLSTVQDLYAELNTFFGGDSKEVTPVPIPNTEVKLFCADGTAWATEWESRTLPKFFNEPGITHAMVPGFLLIDHFFLSPTFHIIIYTV